MAFDPDKYLADHAPKPAFDPDAYLKAHSASTKRSFAGDALDYGLRALDYGAGATRTAAASVAGGINYAAGGDFPVSKDDLINTLKGKAPSTKQYAQNMGVPEGAQLNVPLVGPVSVLDAAGFVGDVALDPLTYLTGGASAVAKEAAEKAAAKQLTGQVGKAALQDQLKAYAEKGLRPLSNAMESAGNYLYKSAYKVPDAKLAKVGVEPLSEVMLNNGRPSGSAKALQTAIDNLTAAKMAERKTIYDAVEQAGGRANMVEAITPAAKRAEEIMRIDPNAGEQVARMGDYLKNYTREGVEVPVSLASDWKTRLYKSSLPQNAYNPLTGRAMPIAADIQKSFAAGLKNSIETAANRVIPESGNRISALNAEVAPLIESSKKIIPTEVQKDATKNAFTSIDGLALGDVLDHPTHLPMFLIKKGADVFNTPLGRTYTGNALTRVGQTGMPDVLMRRALIDANNPWGAVK